MKSLDRTAGADECRSSPFSFFFLVLLPLFSSFDIVSFSARASPLHFFFSLLHLVVFGDLSIPFLSLFTLHLLTVPRSGLGFLHATVSVVQIPPRQARCMSERMLIGEEAITKALAGRKDQSQTKREPCAEWYEHFNLERRQGFFQSTRHAADIEIRRSCNTFRNKHRRGLHYSNTRK
jgi:hypothetical protein